MTTFEQRVATALTADGDVSSLPIAAWKAAIEGHVRDASPSSIADLVRLAHEQPAPEAEERFTLLLADNAGGQSPGGKRSVAVLAGCAVVEAFADPVRRPFALLCSLGARQARWRPALEEATATFDQVRVAAVEQRRLPELKSVKVTLPASTYEKSLPPAGTPVTGDALKAVVEALAEGVTDALGRSQRALTKAAASREAALLEELMVLRWVLSGDSRSAGARWTELSPGEAALAAALDLDSLTAYSLGVPDADALLAQTVALAGHAADSDGPRLRELAERVPDPGDLTDLTPAIGAARNAAHGEDIPAALDLYEGLRLVALYRSATW